MPSAVSVATSVPVTGLSSLPEPAAPAKAGASSTGLTVTVISWVAVLPSSSVTWTVKVSVPWKLALGV